MKRAQERDECIDVTLIELFAERRHFAFYSVANAASEPFVALAEVVKIGSFAAARVIAVAMGAILQKKRPSFEGGRGSRRGRPNLVRRFSFCSAGILWM